MTLNRLNATLLPLAPMVFVPAFAGQAPGAASEADIRISAQDRVYLSDQSSNV